MKDISDIRFSIYARDNNECKYPGCDVVGVNNLQLAHLIKKGERTAKNNSSINYIKQYILDKYKIELTRTFIWDKILNHEKNMITSCPPHESSFNIFFNTVERDKLLDEIWEDINELSSL